MTQATQAVASVNGAHPPDIALMQSITFITTDELEALHLPDREWVIEGVLPVGLVSGITAQSGTGKSWLALYTMRQIASGRLWAGKYSCRRLTTGYLDLEGDYISLKLRWHQLNTGMGRLDVNHAGIHVLSDLGAVNILDSNLANELTATIRQWEIQVLFVDTLSRTHQLDENSADMRLVMQAFDRIARDVPCTVVLLHHAGWTATGRGRGNSAIRDALQHEIMLTEEGGAVKVALVKAKSAQKSDRLTTMSINQTSGGGVELVFDNAGLVNQGEKRRGTVLRLLDVTPEGMAYTALREEVVKLCGCSKATAERDIDKLKDDGAIVKGDDGKYYPKGATIK
jgi:archaellum biogenesis ATPase FlaH